MHPVKAGLLVGGLLLVGYVALRMTGVITPEETWPRYRSAAGGYSVLVPGSIKVAADQTGEIRFQTATMDWNGLVFQAAFTELPEVFRQAGLEPRDVLDKLFERIGDPANVVSKQDLTVQGFPAHHVEYKTARGVNRILNRNILVNERLYRMIVVVKVSQLESQRPHYEKFFNSFALDAPGK